MIPTPSRVLVARKPVDFPKGIAGLPAFCDVHLGEEHVDCTDFVLVSRRRNGLKMLDWTHRGFLLLRERFEKGRLRWPPMQAEQGLTTQAEPAALIGLDPDA